MEGGCGPNPAAGQARLLLPSSRRSDVGSSVSETGPTVFVVDDDPSVRRSTERRLIRSMGFNVAPGSSQGLRDSPEPWEHHLMPRPIAVTAKRPLLFCCGFQVRAPVPESPAYVTGIELERVADSDEREGAVRVVGGEPGLGFHEQTPGSRTLVPRPSVEREDGVGQNRDLEALLGLNPGASEGPVVELSG